VEQKQEVVQSCPTRVFAMNPRNENIDIVNSNNCIFCEECIRKVETFKMPRMIKISMKPNKFIFYVEGTGQLKAAEIVKKVLTILIPIGIRGAPGETRRPEQRIR
jgi:DNA-directed RNA polymerase II subunit RPB3